MNLKNREILFGRDEEEYIVSIEPLRNQPIAEVFTRVNGKLHSRYEPYEYFIYTTDKEKALQSEGLDVVPLLGSNHYNRMVKTQSTSQFYNLRKGLKDCISPYGASQFFLQTGKTLFNGMGFNDPLVMYFDLEVTTAKGYNFPNANRPEDKIFMIAIRTNRGDEKLLFIDNDKYELESGLVDGVQRIKFPDEQKMIQAFVLILRDINPDIIANHNIFNFDLDYLSTRSSMLGVDLTFGRDGSEPKVFQTSIKFADRSREYNNYSIYGRHIIDTQFLCEYADVVLRNMPSYQLKEVVKYLGQASDDRTYIPGENIASVWRGEDPDFTPEDLLNYAIDDVREAEIVYNAFGQAIFELTKMIPMGFQEVFRYGTGNQVEYVFMREYYTQGWSYPMKDPHRSIKGGYADVLKYGLIKGSIVYADVQSLYPSLGVMLKIQPKKDELQIYQKILHTLIDIRYGLKDQMKEAEIKAEECQEKINELKKKLDTYNN